MSGLLSMAPLGGGVPAFDLIVLLFKSFSILATVFCGHFILRKCSAGTQSYLLSFGLISLLLLPFMAGTLPTWQVPGFFFSDTNSSEIPTDGTVIVSRPITDGITATDVESNLSQNL